MSAAAAALPRLARSLPALPPFGIRLAAFAGLTGFCLAHYSLLVVPAAGARVVGLVAVASVAGAALAASARLPRRGAAARIVLLVLLLVAALAVTGLVPRLLLPGNWNELSGGLSRGFAGLDSFEWPYGDGDSWVRLTILLAMPLLVVPATALAFWPARRAAGALRTAAVAPLLAAYAIGATDLELNAWAARGGALLILIAAYLWLPRLRGRQLLVAMAAVAACGAAAIPLAAGLDARGPWVDYRHWNWFAQSVDGTTFAWDHSYGPISWSRSGATLLDIRSKHPHYWRAETLDRFDGLRWMHSESSAKRGDSLEDIPTPTRPKWNEQITFTVRRLQSKLVIGAGTIYRTDSNRVTAGEPDGTVRVLDAPLQVGDTYRVYSYVPDPSAAQMRAAPHSYPARLAPYTWFDLPSAGQSGLKATDVSVRARTTLTTARTIEPLVADQPLGPAEVRSVRSSPYGRVYDLAHRLAAGRPTTYDVVRSTESYLQHGFRYSESPPARRYPLAAFLFQDKIGYCQQFSGAMALMLRMDGIPARVATGFSPGSLNHATHEYEVRDLDAHSWVEVWFSGIGWVPFDPTPATAPAASQSSPRFSISAARGSHADPTTASLRAGDPRSAAAPAGRSGAGGGGLPWPLLAGVGLLAAAGLAALWLWGTLRVRSRFGGGDEGAVRELRAALERLGYRYPAGITLAELERRLRITAGAPAASYVRAVRLLRYAPPGRGHGSVPGQAARRELRRALTAGRGPLARLRGLVVLPPHPRRPHGPAEIKGRFTRAG